MHPIPRPVSPSFFRRPAPELARALLGKVLVHAPSRDAVTGGRIVEAEAYHQDEPASHSFRGWTERNATMFERAGLAYVYRSYGVHWCVNVVAGRRGEGTAVLLRAVEPLWGIETMLARRGWQDSPKTRRDVARGPGRLCAALGIDRSHDGASLSEPPLWIGAATRGEKRPEIVETVRVGITKATELKWRFAIRSHPCVSGPAALRR